MQYNDKLEHIIGELSRAGGLSPQILDQGMGEEGREGRAREGEKGREETYC